MKGSKTLISNALSTLKGNVERTGDPLGFNGVYWTEWSEGLGLPEEGKTLLLTARMYQMLPYVIQTTDLMTTARPNQTATRPATPEIVDGVSKR